nr:alpha/beta fold hydrolase [Bacteroidota bacterium]
QYKVYLVDLRNHGDSFHDEIFTYTAMAQDLVDFMSRKNIDETILLGHSMGGKVAMTVALNHPKKIKKIIIADISPAAYPTRHDVIVEALAALKLEEVASRQDADQQLKEFIPEVGVRQFLLKNLERKKEGGYAWKINLAVIEKYIVNVGEPMDQNLKFNKPTLFIKGGRSKYILDKDLPLINTLFPNNQLEIIPEAGHWLHAEKTEDFFSICQKFLE